MVKEFENKDLPSVGVIIGRFQIDELHSAHKEVIDFVCNRHKKVIVLLGVLGINPVPATKHDPLDFETRRLMLHEIYPNLIISYVKDMKYDDKWSNQVDSRIGDLLAPGQSVMLYGSRDSFIPYYSGRYPTTELESDTYVSATIRREEIPLQTLASKDFRIGCIYAIQNQFDMPQATVDMIIYRKDSDGSYSVLLGRKDYEPSNLYQFPGGFATVDSESYEQDAHREIWEEVGKIEISPLKYLMSKKIDDWRYRSQTVKIKTNVYYAEYLSGIVRPADDIIEARWFKIDYLLNNLETTILKSHCELLTRFAKEVLHIEQPLFH